MLKKYLPWLIWVITSLLAILYLTEQLQGDDRHLFLPGQTSDGHYQIELRCDACHGESFSDEKTMQKNCVNCHGQELKDVKDSHPKSKFTDPRNIDRVKVLDARYCATCHVEHKPEITQDMGVTLPDGFCIKCHLEVGEDRPSHKGMGFETCASAGCHNYHDNRALYEDFLVKHAGEADIKTPAVTMKTDVLQKLLAEQTDRPALSAQEQDQPKEQPYDARIVHDWAVSSHAQSGVNCTGCHQNSRDAWIEKPGYQQCQSCHQIQVSGFLQGKHGMRQSLELSPMQAGWARVPVKQSVNEKQLGCVSCHNSHEFDVKKAAVEACESCHADEHTKNYRQSSHYQLWRQEKAGHLAENSGVSCATCHLPAKLQSVNFSDAVATLHNQNSNLRPNEKMIRTVCLQCHSLAFSIDALADPDLIKSNFVGRPAQHIKSVDLATARVK